MDSCVDLLRKIEYDLTRNLALVKSKIHEISGEKPRILYIAPHLSTGGMPQYLCKCIEKLLPAAEIYCVEYSNLSDDFVVQRNKIQNLLGENYFRLDGEDKTELLQIVKRVCPDVIHFQDFVEFFVGDQICEKIFSPDRPWFIFETCHSSNVKPYNKFWAPDKIVMVNRWMVEVFKNSGFELDVLEYPIENFPRMEKEHARTLLGLDPSKKHVINIGLFTRGKNQGELFEYARQLTDLPIEFHFIGNQAINFQDDWEPLMQNIPSNCKIWGERHDTDLFYQAADLFVFNSTWELNPIVIKESLSWGLPIMMRRLPSYMDDYDSNPLVHYFAKDWHKKDDDYNVIKIKEILGFIT
jgi:glycosyltransferase involved in cell wall biosynthesis